AGQDRQDRYPESVYEPATDAGKGLGQVTVVGDLAAQAWEARKAGIGRQRKHGEHGSNRNVIEYAAPDDSADDLRNDALISRLLLIHRADVIDFDQRGDPGQQDAQDQHYNGQSALGVANGRPGESIHSITYRLDASHGSTAAGKRAEQQPYAERLDLGRQGRRGNDRRWMPRRHD